MINADLAAMKSSYHRQKALLGQVLESPKLYLSDVRSLLRNLWDHELAIIKQSGTIYNDLDTHQYFNVAPLRLTP